MVRVPDAAGQIRSAPVRALRGLFGGIGQLLITADRFRTEEARRERAEDELAGHGREAGQRTEIVKDQPPPEGADVDGDGGDGRYEPLTADASAGDVAQDGARLDAARLDAARLDAGRQKVTRQNRDGRAGRHRATSLQGPAASAQTPTRRFRSLDSTGNVRLLTAGEAVEGQGPDDALRASAVPAGTVPAPRPDLADAALAARTPVSAADLPVPGYDELTVASLRSRLRYLDAVQLRLLADYEKVTAKRADVVAMFERRIAKLQAADARAGDARAT